MGLRLAALRAAGDRYESFAIRVLTDRGSCSYFYFVDLINTENFIRFTVGIQSVATERTIFGACTVRGSLVHSIFNPDKN